MTSNHSSIPTIDKKSNITLTVHRLTDAERLNKLYSEWVIPISGIWTFLAGAGAGIAPLIAWLYNKKRKKKNKYEEYYY